MIAYCVNICKMSDYIGEGFQEGSKLIVVERQAFDHSWTKGVTARHVELRTDDEGKKVWGIEYNVPLRFEAVKGIYKEMLIELATTKGLEVKQDELDASIQKKVRQTWFLGRNGFYIPERILNLKILDLEPQEVLPRHQRNLVGKKNIWHFKNLVESLTAQKKDPKTLESLESLGYTDPEVSRSEALNEVLMDIFRNSKAEFQEFIKTVQASKAPDLLIIHSHGGYGTEIGE